MFCLKPKVKCIFNAFYFSKEKKIDKISLIKSPIFFIFSFFSSIKLQTSPSPSVFLYSVLIFLKVFFSGKRLQSSFIKPTLIIPIYFLPSSKTKISLISSINKFISINSEHMFRGEKFLKNLSPVALIRTHRLSVYPFDH